MAEGGKKAQTDFRLVPSCSEGSTVEPNVHMAPWRQEVPPVIEKAEPPWQLELYEAPHAATGTLRDLLGGTLLVPFAFVLGALYAEFIGFELLWFFWRWLAVEHFGNAGALLLSDSLKYQIEFALWHLPGLLTLLVFSLFGLLFATWLAAQFESLLMRTGCMAYGFLIGWLYFMW